MIIDTGLQIPWLIEARDQSLWRDDSVGILNQLAHLVPVDATIQPSPKPTSVTYVWRTEIPIRCNNHRLLSALRSGTPQVRKFAVVMPMRPQHHELLTDEEAGRAMCRLLDHLRQCGAERANAAFDVRTHRPNLLRARRDLMQPLMEPRAKL